MEVAAFSKLGCIILNIWLFNDRKWALLLENNLVLLICYTERVIVYETPLLIDIQWYTTRPLSSSFLANNLNIAKIMLLNDQYLLNSKLK